MSIVMMDAEWEKKWYYFSKQQIVHKNWEGDFFSLFVHLLLFSSAPFLAKFGRMYSTVLLTTYCMLVPVPAAAAGTALTKLRDSSRWRQTNDLDSSTSQPLLLELIPRLSIYPKRGAKRGCPRLNGGQTIIFEWPTLYFQLCWLFFVVCHPE